MPKLKKNYLLDKIPQILADEPRGKLLDVGCGWGIYSIELHQAGFDVVAADIAPDNFRYHDKIKFQKCNITEKLPFDDSTFDYAIFLETIEHLERPFDMVGELSRVLKPGGKLIISTPNILNLGSRIRFLFEGTFDLFREPVIDFQKHYIGTIENLHIIPWRYHELEYLLYRRGFGVEGIYTDYEKKGLKFLYALMYPFMKIQAVQKENKSRKKGGMDFKRINDILFMNEILYGRHLILKAVNTKKISQSFGYYRDTQIPVFSPNFVRQTK